MTTQSTGSQKAVPREITCYVSHLPYTMPALNNDDTADGLSAEGTRGGVLRMQKFRPLLLRLQPHQRFTLFFFQSCNRSVNSFKYFTYCQEFCFSKFCLLGSCNFMSSSTLFSVTGVMNSESAFP